MKKAKSKREKTLQSIELASRLKSMYGPQDALAKQSVPAKIPLKKGAPQAKRSRDDKTIYATAEPHHNKSVH